MYEFAKFVLTIYARLSRIAGQGLKWTTCASSANCSPNPHIKCRQNVPRVFDVCSQIKSDCKSYFGFVVDKFSELVK